MIEQCVRDDRPKLRREDRKIGGEQLREYFTDALELRRHRFFHLPSRFLEQEAGAFDGEGGRRLDGLSGKSRHERRTPNAGRPTFEWHVDRARIADVATRENR